jgi:hypothetical protein
LIHDSHYKKFKGENYLNKEEFYRQRPELGLESGEIRKKEDNDEYYKLRAIYNKQKYLEMLEGKLGQKSGARRIKEPEPQKLWIK